jgi:MerR family redox-sensitive transcriptional activator SoxR
MISQTLGFTLTQIREALCTLPEHRTPTKSDWERISNTFKQDLDARISQMQSLRDKLDGCIGCGCLSLSNCKLYNPKDRIRKQGQGPRYLLGDSESDAMNADPPPARPEAS